MVPESASEQTAGESEAVALSRINRYLLREVGLAWLAVTVVLLGVLLATRLAHYMGSAMSGEMPAGAIFTLLGLKMVVNMGAMLPAGFFLGTLLALGRLYRDSEMAAMAACGVGPARIYRALAFVTLPLAVVVAGFSLVLGPWAERAAERALVDAQQKADLQMARPGRFMTVGDGKAVIYVERESGDGRMQGVFAAATDERGQRTIVVADSANRRLEPASGDDFLVLDNGERYDGVPGQRAWRRITFAEHGIRLSEPEPVDVDPRRRGRTLSQLWNSGRLSDTAELQWRVSLPLAAIVLALIAVPLAKSAPREGRYARLVSAVFIYMAYLNGLKAADDWLSDGAYSPVVGLWWVHGIFIGLALVLLLLRFRIHHRRPGTAH